MGGQERDGDERGEREPYVEPEEHARDPQDGDGELDGTLHGRIEERSEVPDVGVEDRHDLPGLLPSKNAMLRRCIAA